MAESKPSFAISSTYRLPSAPNAMSMTLVKPSAYTLGSWPGITRYTRAWPAGNGKPVSSPTYNAPSGPRPTDVGTDCMMSELGRVGTAGSISRFGNTASVLGLDPNGTLISAL